MPIILETDRFIIRDIVTEDTKGLLEMESDPEVLKYIGTPPLRSEKEALRVIQKVQKQYRDFGTGRLAIESKNTGEFIGWTGIKYEQEIRDFPYYDLGYRIKRKHWRKGIATETGLASLKYGFKELNLNVIHAGARLDHWASHHVLGKLGFRIIEEFQFDNHQNYWFGLSREDFGDKS